MAEEKRINAGEVIVKQGDDPDGFFLLKQGSVGIYVDDVLIDVFMAKDSVVGEMSMILDRSRTATVKARSHCTIVQYRGKSMQDIIEEDPQVGDLVMRSLATRLDAANRKILVLTNEEREKIWED